MERKTLEAPTLTALRNIKNKHAESKKIAVKVYIVRAETEELAVHKQNNTQDPHYHHHHQEQARRV